MDNKCFIGIDSGGTKVSGALFDSNGTILTEDTVLLKGAGGKKAASLMIGLIISLIEHAHYTGKKPVSLGVCIPGIVYQKTGKVWAPNIPDWDDYPLLDDLKRSVGNDLSISIDSDRACYILGETWLGCARGSKDAIFVAVGTGIGAGILMDGKILRGYKDIAGATGWMALQKPYDKKYDTCGCFEYYASGDGIVRTAQEIITKNPDYQGMLNKNNLRAQDVFAAYEEDDPIAIETFDNVIELWGMAVANYVSLFNPEKIIFGGGVFGPGVCFIPRIIKEAEKWAQPIGIKQVTVVHTTLGKNAGLIGAGRLAIMNEKKDI
ncbi:MAG: ROK family protein [Candidatus Marinimicrobia bacterium]|nr:ROK family protein [Candidatus Neomarinimicrobiota bacterium]